MHDHTTEHGDFQTIVNAFTHGLRELPTDYAARVKNFLAEYLGNLEHPVPFGGRTKDFERLDDWLTDTQAPPYLLLAAPAGRGKSALLVHWCRRLLARRDLSVAYFPVSIRFRTNLAGVTFPSLVALLAKLHGEQVPADPNMHEEVWRGLFLEYITRPLADGRPLVLVLDGVDEAADWVADLDLFPLKPPPGLRIVLSARYLANDQDANAWLKRLGWLRQGLARTLELYPLDRTGIASVLVQMGFPLDLLSTRVNIVSELYRLSEGDPLLVRLYVDDLWERGEAAMRFQPEDLRAIRPGLAGYFERWWKDQRLLWSKEAPQREAAAQIVLNLLAGALGPLSKQDILSLLPDEISFGSDDLKHHLAPLARFVTGDGIHQGYVFSHPRLGNYFLEERLTESERQEVERRFLTWGKQTLEALNQGHLEPEKASAYIVQYYGAHLERAHADVHDLLELVSGGWRHAWEKLDRANAGFLSDVERAWRAVERENAAASSSRSLVPCLLQHPPTDRVNEENLTPLPTSPDVDKSSGTKPNMSSVFALGSEIRCLLCQVSVNSVTSNISPRLMLEAVKTGIWTPAQGLASIRLITDLAPRARELVDLAPHVQEPLRTTILQEALDTVATIKDEYARLDTLVDLAPGLSEELLWQVLEVVPSIDDEADRAGLLAELAPALSPYAKLIERALDFVQEMEEEEYRVLALEELAPCFSADQHNRVLQLVGRCKEDRHRATALAALLPHLPESFLQDVLQEAHMMQDGLSRIRLLTELVMHLPDPLKKEVVQEALELEHDIEDLEYRVEVLVKLAPFLPENKLQQALQEVQLLWDETARAQALSGLIQSMPEKLLPELLQTVLAMRSEECRTQVLIELLPRLPEELLEKTVDRIQATWDEGCRAELLAQLAPYASEALLPRLLEIASTIEDQGYRVWLLAELEAPLAEKLNETDSDIFTVFQAIPTGEERLQTFLAILSRLSEDALSKIFSLLLPGIFSFMWDVQSENGRAHLLAKLGSRLPEKWLPEAIIAVGMMKDEGNQVQALVALVPRVGTAVLQFGHAIGANVFFGTSASGRGSGGSSRTPQKLEQAKALGLDVDLSEQNFAAQVKLRTDREGVHVVLDIVRSMKDRAKRAQVLEALVSSLPDERKGEQVQEMLQVLQAIKDDGVRARLVGACLPYMSGTLSSERTRIVVEAVHAMRDKGSQIYILKALAPYIPEKRFEDMLAIVQHMQNEREQVYILKVLVPYIPEKRFEDVLKIVQYMYSEREQAQALEVLAPHVPKALFSRLLQMAGALSTELLRMQVLTALMAYTPEDTVVGMLDIIQDMQDGNERAELLRAQAAYVPEAFFSQFWEVALALTHEGQRTRVLGALASCIPARFFPRYWEAILETSSEEGQLWVLRELVSHQSESLFKQIWEAVLVIEDRRKRTQIQALLLPYVPERFFSLVWETVREIPEESVGWWLLEALAPRVPEEIFSQFFMILQTISHQDIRIQVLKALIPRIPEDFFFQFFQAVQSISYEGAIVPVLTDLIPYVPERFFSQMWEAVRALKNKKLQENLLADLAPHIPKSFLSQFWAVVCTIEDVAIRTEILIDLLPDLTQERCAELLEMLLELPYGEQRLGLLEVLVPYLSQEKCIEILEDLIPPQSEEQLADVLTQTSWEKRWQRRTLAVLVPYLPEARRPAIISTLLKATEKLRMEEDQVWLLTKLAPHIPEELLKLMLDAAWSIAAAQYRVQVWKALLPTLSQTGWAIVLDLIMAQMCKTGDADFALHMLKAADAPMLQSSSAQFYPIVHEVLRLLAQRERRDVLPDLALLAPVVHLLGGEKAVIEMFESALEVGCWWP